MFRHAFDPGGGDPLGYGITAEAMFTVGNILRPGPLGAPPLGRRLVPGAIAVRVKPLPVDPIEQV